MNLNVSTMISRVVKERNDLGFKCHPVMLPDLGILKEFSQKKVFMVLLSSMDLSKSLITSYHSLPLLYLTGFDGKCGVLTDKVDESLLDSNLLQGQRLDS